MKTFLTTIMGMTAFMYCGMAFATWDALWITELAHWNWFSRSIFGFFYLSIVVVIMCIVGDEESD